MQKWEYKLVFRHRPLQTWKWDIDIEKIAAELGNDGWELVSVAPRSSCLVNPHSSDPRYAKDSAAGITDGELWVFKRPKD